MREAVRWGYFARAPAILWQIVFQGRYDFTFDLVPMRSVKMSMRKRINLLKAGLNLVVRRAKPWSWPIHMQIELTNYCSLKCPVCPTGSGMLGRPKGNLDLALYAKLMDEVGPFLLTVMLWGWGEPLLHPNFAETVRIAREHGVISVFSTNGQLLCDDHVLSELIREPPTYLIVAIDGLTDETNSVYRVGSNLAGVLDGVRRLAQMKQRRGMEFPILHMRYIVMKHNQHELPHVQKFAADAGFDMLTVRALSIIDVESGSHRDLVPDDDHYQAYGYESDKMVKREDFTCQHAFAFPGLFADGTVVMCDQDFNATHPYGRFSKDRSFADIWFGEESEAIRKTAKKSRESISFCRHCPYANHKSNDCSIELVHLHAPSVGVS